MITSVDAFVGYFEGVNRRALRDLGTLPEEAERWAPPAGGGEGGWTIGQIVAHMAASRRFFVGAYRGEGWVAEAWRHATTTREQWRAALSDSAAFVRERLLGTPAAWLERKVQPVDAADHPVSGWRLLMLMTEHDIHHRSQVDTYAGVMGWPVAHIYGRSAEEVGLGAGPVQPG